MSEDNAIDWNVKEILGYPIAELDAAVTAFKLSKEKGEEFDLVKYIYDHPVKHDDIAIGMKVAVITLFGTGDGMVTSIEGDTAYAETNTTIFPLQHDKNSGFWVNNSAINKSVLDKVTLGLKS